MFCTQFLCLQTYGHCLLRSWDGVVNN
uniref:Uncharacterized protein n=1 Tax=Rhizophora mucronata TaxID=61149 RepID=A0A2P2QFP7_RHIMU